MISARLLEIIAIVFILILSYAIYFTSQNAAEWDIRNALIDQQRQRQLETNKAISFHITSDLDSILARLNLIANAKSVQSSDFTNNQTQHLLAEQYSLIASLTGRPDEIFLVDNKGIVKTATQKGNFPNFNANLSNENYVIKTQKGLAPGVSISYQKNDSPKIVISYPILKEGTGEFLGLIAALMPSTFFANYGNIYRITSQYLAVLDRNGTHIVHGNKALIGSNFFDDYTQNFTRHNKELNDLVRKVLDGQSGYVIYRIASGERITTGFPVSLHDDPLFFIFLVTPTASLCGQVGDILQSQKTETILLLILVTASAVIFIIFLLIWTNRLDRAVYERTMQLKSLNEVLTSTNEKLQVQGTLQKDFINIAAHELRTPTQAILGYAEMLQHNPEKINYTTSILNNAVRLEALIEDVLDVSRIEGNGLLLNKTPFYIDELIQGIVNEFRTKESTRNAGVEIIYQNADKIKVIADSARVEQVINNLIENAIKFTGSGTITVEVKKDLSNRQAIVSIKDTGKGVDAEVLPNMFEKFVTKSQKGLGLGLYIARSIVESHRGKIWYEKNPDSNGSTFKFSLPLEDNE